MTTLQDRTDDSGLGFNGNAIGGNDRDGDCNMNKGQEIGLVATRQTALASMAVGWVLAMVTVTLCIVM